MLVGESPLRLRALAERPGTTDATASRTVDVLDPSVRAGASTPVAVAGGGRGA